MAAGLTLLIALGVVLLSHFGLTVRVAVGNAPLMPFISTDPKNINTDTVGEQSFKAKLLGIVTFDLTVMVYDDTPPQVTTRDLLISKEFSLEPIDFIASVNDHSELTYEFVSPPNTDANGTASVRVTDAANNSVTVDVSFYVTDEYSSYLTVQLGSSLEEASSAAPEFGFEDIDLSKCQSVRLYTSSEGSTRVLALTVEDTEAPVCKPRSHDLLIGQTLSAEDFVTDIKDASEVEVSYVDTPDFSKIGTQTVTVRLTDIHGNSTETVSKLNIHNLQGSIVIEAGTTADELSKAVKRLLNNGAALPRITDKFEPEYKSIGTYETELIGEYSAIPFEIIIEDTTPPHVVLRKLTVMAGEVPKILDFVVECDDASSVQFEYKEIPDVENPGNFLVTVVATDRAGNTSETGTVLKVIRDDIPPIIYGVKNITIYEGETVSYRSGVYAVDDRDGQMSVKVDASKVNTSAAGTYYVTYTATDSEGNTATATAALTVKPLTIGAVYALADEVLAEIITDSMTDTQKARAIYDWCRGNIKYSTATSNLMGYYAKASYSGLTRRYGNCYTYYAVSGVLLTRAGITNIMIQRDSTTSPHYWNLVNIGGFWYHFDTCPQPSPHDLEVFLLTDSEVRAFSRDKVADYYKFNAANYPATP